MRTRSAVRPPELATLGAAGVLFLSSLLPSVAADEQIGLRMAAALWLAFAIVWFHLMPPLPTRERAVIGCAAVQVLATVVVLVTGGLESRYFTYFLLPIFGTTLVYEMTAWLAAALVAVGGFAALWIMSLTGGAAHVRSDTVVTELAALAAVLFLSGVVSREATRTYARLRAQSEELTSSLAHREDYLAMVAHELRNPLVGIRAASRVLAMGKAEGERVTHTAQALAAEATTALELLDSLTDLQSIEAGRMRSMLAPTDLAGLVRAATAAIRESSGRTVTVSGADSAVEVLGDERRLTQVLSNLLRNAVRYSPEGTPLEVSLGLSADRSAAIVVVRDHGPGVPPAERGRLFQKFARLSTAGGTRGSGLGLYICREIVRDHGGELTADWPSGGGSAFSFTVPLLSSTPNRPT